jgi:hypothetical protein
MLKMFSKGCKTPVFTPQLSVIKMAHTDRYKLNKGRGGRYILRFYILMAWRILERELNLPPPPLSFFVRFRSGSTLSFGNLRLQAVKAAVEQIGRVSSCSNFPL